eukprot:7377767-Prymnesium_polylepis.1
MGGMAVEGSRGALITRHSEIEMCMLCRVRELRVRRGGAEAVVRSPSPRRPQAGKKGNNDTWPMADDVARG